MKQEQVWVLHISHKHGDSFFAYRQRKSALNYLAQWARKWWHEAGVPGSYADLSDSYLIIVYFDHVAGRESYNVKLVDLED